MVIYPSSRQHLVSKYMQNQIITKHIEQGLAPFNRRTFLKAGISLAIGGSTLLTLGCSSEPVLDPSLKALTSSQQALFQRLTQILLPTEGTSLTSISVIPVLSNINHLFAGLDTKILADLEGATTLFEYGSLVLGGHFSRFTKLNDQDAVAYLEEWQNGNSIQRGIATTLKKMVYASYWRDERTWGPVDYDGPVSVRWGLPSLGNAPLPVE